MNVPLQYLATRIRIFRKKENSWWRIAPAVTLTSLSGTYVNTNLSIIFSSQYSDINELNKRMRFAADFNILVPKNEENNNNYENINFDDIIAVDKRKMKNLDNIDEDTIDVQSNEENPSTTNYPANNNSSEHNNNTNVNQDNLKPMKTINKKSLVINTKITNIYNVENVKRKICDFAQQPYLLSSSTSPQDNNNYCDESYNNNNNNNDDDDSGENNLNDFMSSIKKYKRFNEDGIYKLDDLGYHKSNAMSVIKNCPNDNKNRFCLNLVVDQIPVYKVKINLPFRENAIIPRDYYKVRIANIVADGTLHGVVQLTVSLVNEGFFSHEFSIIISDCPITSEVKNTVIKPLSPHIGDTVTYLLPLEENNPSKKYTCEVQVKNFNNIVIAHRQLTIKPKGRCLCIWYCSCHCFDLLASTNVINACQELSGISELEAGFEDEENFIFSFWPIIIIILLLIFFIFLLGLLKATIGLLCSERVDKFGYNYVQPNQTYENASRFRRFCVNCVFFLIIPFIWCCLCCCVRRTFTKNLKKIIFKNYKDKEHGKNSKHEKKHKGKKFKNKFKRKKRDKSENNENENIKTENDETTDYEQQYYDNDNQGSSPEHHDGHSSDPEKLEREKGGYQLQKIKPSGSLIGNFIKKNFKRRHNKDLEKNEFDIKSKKNLDDRSNIFGSEYSDGEETILSQEVNPNDKTRFRYRLYEKPISKKLKTKKEKDYLFDNSTTTERDFNHNYDNEFALRLNNNEDEQEEEDKKFVLDMFEQSRESLQKLNFELEHKSEENANYCCDPAVYKKACKYVKNLKDAKITYRRFKKPIGNVNVLDGQEYSIRGYFFPAVGPGYQFITHSPNRQHWIIYCDGDNVLRPMLPPLTLYSNDFTRNYNSKMDVYEAHDLSTSPSINAPCINVLVQDRTMYFNGNNNISNSNSNSNTNNKNNRTTNTNDRNIKIEIETDFDIDGNNNVDYDEIDDRNENNKNKNDNKNEENEGVSK